MPKMPQIEKQKGDGFLVGVILFFVFLIITLAVPACQEFIRVTSP